MFHFLGFHKWGKWSKPYYRIASGWYQIRVCAICGKVVTRYVWNYDVEAELFDEE